MGLLTPQIQKRQALYYTSHSNHHMTNPEKCITQDTHSVTYDPGFLSFLPTKERIEKPN